MNKLLAIWQLFKQGNSVADAAAWKNRQISVTVLAGVILAVINVLSSFGLSVPIDVETANAIAGGVIAVVNVVLTLTTSDKVGIPDKSTEDKLKEETKDETNEHKETFKMPYDTSAG